MRLRLIYSFLLITFFNIAQDGPVTIDKIVAQIGDKIILMSDIQSQKFQMLEAKTDINEIDDCGILEDLMNSNLLLNQALLDSIQIPDAQVDAEMENRIRVIEQQIGGRAKLEEFYGKTVAQIKREFKDAIKDRLLTQEMERSITQSISVTPKEVEKFYNKIPKDSIPLINATLSFQQIVIYPEVTKADEKRAEAQLAEIRLNIEAGKSFETQARINSMDPGSAREGGKIEASRGMMVPQFEAAVFSLKAGEMSDVFETEYGYHIVKLEERKGSDYICRHILITPQYSNKELESAAIKMDSCFALLTDKTLTWDQAVTKYSNDKLTMQNKGIITNPITGEQTWSMEDLNQVDQQIFVLTDALEVNDITKPGFYQDIYERKQGIRIVKLMNRSEPHLANLSLDYTLIKRAAENEKKSNAINTWIEQKISGAYIRIDSEFQDCQYNNNWNK
ncbi:MAG: peptidyl-prolyl cis-trans isomerase SurA [Psychromonas sp.]|jgi:peptidyl-prolyl cis-trans isomerase SurA